jgi:hypothetical protein
MRAVVDCLPYETKLAMLEGIERYDIVAGAYSMSGGGVCPMLAAHRCGPRTDFRAFARAWDRFTGARRRGRKASERELRTLKAQLEQSVWNEEQARDALLLGEPGGWPDRATTAGRKSRRRRSLGAWLVPSRDLDQYRRALDAALAEIGTEPAERQRIAAALVHEETAADPEPAPLTRA